MNPAIMKNFCNVSDQDIDTRSKKKKNVICSKINNNKTSVADLSFYYLLKTNVYSILTLQSR